MRSLLFAREAPPVFTAFRRGKHGRDIEGGISWGFYPGLHSQVTARSLTLGYISSTLTGFSVSVPQSRDEIRVHSRNSWIKRPSVISLELRHKTADFSSCETSTRPGLEMWRRRICPHCSSRTTRSGVQIRVGPHVFRRQTSAHEQKGFLPPAQRRNTGGPGLKVKARIQNLDGAARHPYLY